jgi:hypothetical protein
MDTLATVEIRLRVSDRVELLLDPRVEVSLDCCVCQRVGRTIVFDSRGDEAYCTPTHHPFPGETVAIDSSYRRQLAIGTYSIRYQTGQFIDVKRGQPAVRHPTWARVHFSLGCPRCSAVVTDRVQNNQGRPWVKDRCQCGAALGAFDGPEFPILQAHAVSGEHLFSLTRSRDELFVTSVDSLSERSRRLLAEVAGLTWPQILEQAGQRGRVCVVEKFNRTASRTFADVERVMSALRDDRAAFELRDNGRPIRTEA